MLGSFAPDLVLVSLGTNDAFTSKTPEALAAEASELVELLRNAGAEVVWLGAPTLPPTYGGRAPDLSALDAIEEAVEDAGAYYYDTTTLEIPRAADRLHPTPAGYSGWAGAVWQWLS